jgi:hypothetical protein
LIQFEAPMIPPDSFSITEDQVIKVAGRLVHHTGHPDMFTIEQLIENMHKLKWSCFMLCAGRENEQGDSEWYWRFVLVVRWEADQVTAERIGSFKISSHSSEDTEYGPLGEESWTWRRVRLI